MTADAASGGRHAGLVLGRLQAAACLTLVRGDATEAETERSGFASNESFGGGGGDSLTIIGKVDTLVVLVLDSVPVQCEALGLNGGDEHVVVSDNHVVRRETLYLLLLLFFAGCCER